LPEQEANQLEDKDENEEEVTPRRKKLTRTRNSDPVSPHLMPGPGLVPLGSAISNTVTLQAAATNVFGEQHFYTFFLYHDSSLI
jgi:hypothetical protein